MQAWLASQPHPAEWIWTSDAARALATANFVAQAFPSATLTADHRLYGATANTLLRVIGETPTSVKTLAVVAHNPGITLCLNLLTGRQVVQNLPSFGAALLQWQGDTHSAASGLASLLALTSPKALPVN